MKDKTNKDISDNDTSDDSDIENNSNNIPTIIIEDDLRTNNLLKNIELNNLDKLSKESLDKLIDVESLSLLFSNLLNNLSNQNQDENNIKIIPSIIEFKLDSFDKVEEKNNEKNNEKNIDNPINNKKYRVDSYSTLGSVDCLDNWFNNKLNSNILDKNITDDYSSESIDNASANGRIKVLDWWLKKNKEYNLPLKYTNKAINLASRNGQIFVLNWWLNSNLELKYNEDAIDNAANYCKISVLDWWLSNHKDNKVRFEYSSNSIDYVKLDEDKLLTLVEWWKENNLEFKYTKIFLSYLEMWSYSIVYKYLVDNLMIKSDEKIIFKEKNKVINLFELFSGSPVKKNKDSFHNKIDITKLPEDIQKHIREKEEELNNNMLINGKAKEYIDNLIKIPFGKYKNENIFKFLEDFIKKINSLNLKNSNTLINKIIINNESDLITFFNKIEFNMDKEYNKYYTLYKKFIDIRVQYLNYVNNILDNTTYGHDSTKKQIKCIIAQWLSGGINKGIVLGIQGPPGVGKTTLIKNALSKCIVNFINYDLDLEEPVLDLNTDNSDLRPFCFISLGGTTNGSTLAGHNITYHGATSGDIVKNLKEAGIMNPILYFDELDKISNTEHGHEISSILTHITDPVQNEHFTDRYFSEVKIDLSKCIIIFSYNDSNKVDKILLDRIQEICLDAITNHEKIVICKKFLLPEIYKSIGYNNDDFIFSDDKLEMIILEYTYEAGVRKLKEKLQDIIRTKHLERLENKSINTKSKIVNKFIEDTFFDYPKMNYKKINSVNKIGYINGMYATTNGLGGITIIQVKPMYNKEILGIQITGNVEKVMNESIQVARTVAYNLLSNDEKQKISEEFKDTGLHIHCPEGATPKDGPSAGTAITCAIYSTLINKPIKNNIAITGEIDLDGNITMIGGLYAKLYGAKRAGVKLAIVPKENMHDIDIIKKKNKDIINKDFKIKFVSHIEEVIKIIF